VDARGAAGYRDAALRILRRLGERSRPAAASADSGDVGGELAALTPRERGVAALVAEGRTNRQIGAQLHLSEKTIEKHVSSTMAKLGVTSRTGIARLVEREGPGLGTSEGRGGHCEAIGASSRPVRSRLDSWAPRCWFRPRHSSFCRTCVRFPQKR
jgi:DNA-binding CsgD family transcriptional regulator